MNKKDFETVVQLDKKTKELQAEMQENIDACRKVIENNYAKIKSAFNQAFKEIYGEPKYIVLNHEYNHISKTNSVFMVATAVEKNGFTRYYLEFFFSTDGFYAKGKGEQKFINHVNEILRGE